MLHRGIIEGRRASGNMMKYLLMGTSSNFGNMFSMALASVFLPFLPMLPTQILLNNFLYDLAQITIPSDNVDRTYLRRPQRWDMRLIRNFMLFIGPVSSVFDFLTFFVLLRVFHASEILFHTGWFVESLATQTLVLFVIRTLGSPFQSRPSRALTISTLTIVGVGLALPVTPLAPLLGFTVPPASIPRLPGRRDRGVPDAGGTGQALAGPRAHRALGKIPRSREKFPASRRRHGRWLPSTERNFDVTSRGVTRAHELLAGGTMAFDQKAINECLDHSTINEWLQLIQAEYREIPGLHLTKPQVQRLWGLDPVTCDALLSTLEDVKFLRKTQNNGYVRRDLGR